VLTVASWQFKWLQNQFKETRGHQTNSVTSQINKLSGVRPKKFDDANSIMAIQMASNEQQAKSTSCQVN